MPNILSRRWLLTTILVVIGTLVLARLGFWQLQRLAERRVANDAIRANLELPVVDLPAPGLDPAALNFRHVRAAGSFDPTQEIVLRNRTRNDEPGVHILTALRIAGSNAAVLVDRGWIPYDSPRTNYPISGTATIEGVARAGQTRSGFLSPSDPEPSPDRPRVEAWFRVDIAQIQKQVPYPLLPIYIEQAPGSDPNQLPARVYDLDLSDGPHLSYAIQWFSFALILLAGYVIFVRRTES